PEVAVEAGGANLLLEDGVGLAEDLEALLVDLAADDADREAGPREGLAPDHPVGEAELGGDGADLVLEQHPQRLDEVEVEIVREAADVVVGLDRGRAGAPARLDHVGVERSLDEVADVGQLPRFLLADPDDLLADDLPLALGFVDAGEAVEETLAGVDVDQLDAEALAEPLDHLVGLALAEQAVIDEHAGEPIADRLVDERRGGGGVDPAGESADDAAVADLIANPFDLLVDDRRRRPLLLTAGHLAQEALEDGLAVRRVHDLGVELDPVEAALGILARGDRRARARRERGEPRRRLVDAV